MCCISNICLEAMFSAVMIQINRESVIIVIQLHIIHERYVKTNRYNTADTLITLFQNLDRKRYMAENI